MRTYVNVWTHEMRVCNFYFTKIIFIRREEGDNENVDKIEQTF